MENRLLLGTANPGKVAELKDLLAGGGCQLLSLDELSPAPEVDETGSTLAENAALKATAYAQHLACGPWRTTPAWRSRPCPATGIHTARYAGPRATASENRARLLAELDRVPDDRRTAAFTCLLALADPAGTIRATSQGICRGRIRRQESGGGGFGYDSLFEVLEYHRTFAELGPAAKGVLSHRAGCPGDPGSPRRLLAVGTQRR